MSDVPVYVVANLQVNDTDTYLKYEKGFFPLLKKHGGSFMTFDDSPLTFEGATPREGRIVMFNFPSEQAAKDWYGDPEYQALSEHRRTSTTLQFLTMVKGLPAR